MLEVKNISSGYGNRQVLNDISLYVNPNDVIFLTGLNGSGKSTLLKCIYNLIPLWSGEISFENKKINGLKPSDLIEKGIVYIPQKDFYFDNLTVEENLEISSSNLPKKYVREKISEVINTIDFQHLKKRKPFNLSGGERKILAFGMALMHNPKLLLFDEPFSGLDIRNHEILLLHLSKTIIKPGNSVIIVDHVHNSNQLFNRRIVLELGKIISH